VVQAIQGKTNNGQWLQRLSRPKHNTDVWPHGLGDAECTAEQAEGFAAVHGKGSGWFVTFMDIPDDHPDRAWDVEGAQLGLAQARVVGYQLRVDQSHVDTARFLFRSFAPLGAHPASQPFTWQLWPLASLGTEDILFANCRDNQLR
jgi:hypothetical protein